MKVNLGTGAQNSHDWDRVLAGNFSSPPETPDWQCVEGALALGDLAEPLGFDGIWFPEHCGTPYGMTPNPIQALTYFAGRTERVGLGTFVAVAPWWNPVRLAHQIAYLDILSKGRYNTIGIGRGVSKSEFDAVGVPREESRERFNEMPRHPRSWPSAVSGSPTTARSSRSPRCRCAPSRSARICSRGSTARPRRPSRWRSCRGAAWCRCSSATSRSGCRRWRCRRSTPSAQEEGFEPCQPKNVMFMYCTPTRSRDAASRPTSGSGRPTGTSPCTTDSPTPRTSRASRDMRPTRPAKPPRPQSSPRP